MSRMNLSEVYTPQRDPSLSEKMLTNDKLIRRNSFSSKEDTHYNKFHNTSTTRPNHKLNKSSSCTGFTCLPKQDEIKVIFPKWSEHVPFQNLLSFHSPLHFSPSGEEKRRTERMISVIDCFIVYY